MGKKADKKKAVAKKEEVEEIEEVEETEPTEEPEAEEPEEPEETEQVEETEPVEETEEVEEPTDEEIIDAAADVTESLGLEPALYMEGMDGATVAKRLKKAWKFIQAEDVLKDETMKTLIALGWEPPKKKASAAGKPGKPAKAAKPAKEKKEKVPKEPKEKKAPMSWKDPARLNSAMAVIIYFSVISPEKTIEEIQKEIEKRGFTGASLKSISAQGGYARRVMNCARDLNLLK